MLVALGPIPQLRKILIIRKRSNRLLAFAKNPTNKLTMDVEKYARNDYNKNFIKFIISPGTMSSKPELQPRGPLPTGGNFLVTTFSKQWTVQMTPDASGRILLLGLPFFEAPFVRIVLDANGGFSSWYPLQFPGFGLNDPGGGMDPLKTNRLYAYRFSGQSMTAAYSGAPLSAQGSVTGWCQPVSLDTKVVYNDASASTPTSFVRTLDRVPISSAQVASVAKVQTTFDAKQGMYIVNRHTDRLVPFTYRNSDQNKAQATVYYADTANGRLANLTNPTTINNYLAFSDDNFIGEFLRNEAGNTLIPVSAPTCTDLTGILFENLEANAVVSCKFTLGVEAIPKMNSTWLNTVQQMLPFDGVFLHDLAEAERRLQRIGNSNSNDLGSFFKGLNGIMQVAGNIAQSIAPALPPQAQMVVSGLAGTLPKITNALAQATNANKQAAAVVKEVNKLQQSAPGTVVKTNFQPTPVLAVSRSRRK